VRGPSLAILATGAAGVNGPHNTLGSDLQLFFFFLIFPGELPGGTSESRRLAHGKWALIPHGLTFTHNLFRDGQTGGTFAAPVSVAAPGGWGEKNVFRANPSFGEIILHLGFARIAKEDNRDYSF